MSGGHGHTREQTKHLQEIADEFGVALEMEPTRKGHIKVIFRAGKQQTAIIVAKGHGGDWRGRQNNLARARRHLRELTGRAT